MVKPDGGLRFRFLGGCEIAGPQGPIHLESAKTTALTAFLVLTRSAHGRAKLMEMFWPELSEERAAAALRRALWDQRRRLGREDGTEVLLADRQAVAFNGELPHECDVERVQALCAASSHRSETAGDEAGALRAAIALYRGDLLDGFTLAGAAAFEEWLAGERERLRLVALQALRRMIALMRGRGEQVRALGYARRLLVLDPWLEEAHRAAAELLALTGQHGAALQQLEACRRVLAQELGVSPSAKTLELERRLREPRRLDAQGAPVAPEPAGLPLPRHNMPIPATPFVGREEELGEISRLLADPDCRLLTLLGPGGVGKTRLALQAAYVTLSGRTERRPAFERVAFVAPGTEQATDVLIDAIAGALGLAPASDQDVKARVVGVLRDRRVLLVLDSFEHRLAESGLLSELLGAAAELRVLATSRQRLDLGEEWVLAVGGLGLPGAGSGEEADRSAAVQLFMQGARRASVGFVAGAVELAAVAGICRALGGMPLAIELAAAWMHALTPAELAAELAGSLDLLSASRRGDAGLRAVFDHSYARLAPAEQRAVRALSVLSGGMTRASAAAVAGATPDILRALADRSFLRFDPATRRYSMHEVLRHFAGARLRELPGELAGAWARHRRHLAGLVGAVDGALVARGERSALAAVAAEADNLRACWSLALAERDAAFVAAVLPSMAVLCEARGWYREGERLAGEAVELLRRERSEAAGGGVAAARALVSLGGLRNRLGRYDDAAADLREALALLGEGHDGDRAAALFHLGDGALAQGRFAEAKALLERSRELASASGNARVLGDALGRLGRAVLDEGRHAEARVLLAESLAVARRSGNQQAACYAANQLGYVAYFDGDLDAAEARFSETLQGAQEADDPAATVSALNGLAYVAEDRGELDRATELYRHSLALAQDQGDRFAAGRVLMLLGEVSRKRGRLAEARRSYEESLAINAALGSRFIVGVLHGNLAFVACGEGRLDEARQHVVEAFREYRATGSVTVALPAVIGLAEIARVEGDDGRALSLLGLVLAHPGNRQDHRLESERVLATLRLRCDEGAVATGLAAGHGLALETLIDSVLSPAPGGRGRRKRATA